MKLCKLEDITAESVLAKPVLTSDYTVLLSEGIVLRSEYIEKLKEMGIKEVYIKQERIPDAEEVAILKKDIENNVKTQIKNVLERHTYNHNEELSILNDAAENVISNILEEDKVVQKVFDIKERSSDLYEHSLSLCSLAVLTAIKLGLSDEQVHDIGVSSLLHDIGMRYLALDKIDEDISKLSTSERAEYKKHPVYGFSAIKTESWISENAKNVILYHHERLDGSGYPLKATDISIESKIVGVCDTFDEMICGIGYSRVKVYEALKYLKENKDTKFDAKVVDAFLNFTAVYPAGSVVKTNEGEVGIVIRQSKGNPDRPVLKIIQDKIGNKVFNDIIRDLTELDNIFIETVLE